MLVVDDQYFIRDTFKKHLENFKDIEVIEAANGDEALGKMLVVKPDLILLDLVMPNKDGLTVLKEMRDDVVAREIPVIVISSHAAKEVMDTAKGYGAKEFIDKTQLNNSDFMGVVLKYLGM
ncbi:MAG: Response regulator [candidate division CPR2 bacterium GW2011_GWC1_41_48]|uniref:Response regulator n=1 Tax=candidate division CPR2 bacterium GW2011_GWC1_41_48 TaxID=1618344 RepID=A0A0G0Z9C3_UNCC2|nr:MAG: Response regulator [candidate division CPR2 bacterium GW2011_GWC2_39_35]KKS09613.1 MAG: Response regulator [candidate division CPR2 bacterium GW2011_GWC1_41_48]